MDMVRSVMTYSNLLNSFWGHALETIAYILNLVPFKLVPTAPTELWTGSKTSLWHVQNWGSPAQMLKGKADKLESRTNVCLFWWGTLEERKLLYFIVLRIIRSLLAPMLDT